MEAMPALGQARNKHTRNYAQAGNKHMMNYAQARNKDHDELYDMQVCNNDKWSF